MSGVDYTHLPESVRLEDTLAEVDTRPVPDPDAGLNRSLEDALKDGG